MNFTDAVTVSSVRRTSDGYLVAQAKAVRSGIQMYAGIEVGMTDRDMVRIYRPAIEVQSRDSLQSFSHAPITIDHPSGPVTAENWRDLSVGEVSTAALPDGEWIALPLILKDAKAIAAVEAGKRELSAGYTCELDMTPGITSDGQSYDGQQKTIRINHLALVDKARAGSEARIGDAAHWGISPLTMSKPQEDAVSEALKTVVLGDKAAQVALADAPIIEAFKADAAKMLADAKTAHDQAMAAKDAELAKAEAERDAAKAKVLSDADLDAKVLARGDLIAKARAIHDADYSCKSDGDIRKAVVVAKRGAGMADKSAAYIDAAFDILAEADPVREALKDGKTVQPSNAAAAHQTMVDGMATAWNTKGTA